MEKRNGPDKWDITADFANPFAKAFLFFRRDLARLTLRIQALGRPLTRLDFSRLLVDPVTRATNSWRRFLPGIDFLPVSRSHSGSTRCQNPTWDTIESRKRYQNAACCARSYEIYLPIYVSWDVRYSKRFQTANAL